MAVVGGMPTKGISVLTHGVRACMTLVRGVLLSIDRVRLEELDEFLLEGETTRWSIQGLALSFLGRGTGGHLFPARGARRQAGAFPGVARSSFARNEPWKRESSGRGLGTRCLRIHAPERTSSAGPIFAVGAARSEIRAIRWGRYRFRPGGYASLRIIIRPRPEDPVISRAEPRARRVNRLAVRGRGGVPFGDGFSVYHAVR